MTHDADALRRWTESILDPSREVHSLHSEVADVAALLERVSGVERPQTDLGAGESRTPDGLAISPGMAALCADDFVRTGTFLRGVHAAICDARRAHPERPARVLYVGCGPYATLATPLMSVLTPQDVAFELLDIHETSTASAQRVADALGFGAFVSAVHTRDAMDHALAPEAPPDVIVLEILQTALAAEPQVPVTRHLLEQAPEARLVPESIRVELALLAAGQVQPGMPSMPGLSPLGPAFVLDAEAVASWAGRTGRSLPGGSVRLPASLGPDEAPMLSTTIRTYGEHVMEPYTSGLTMPRALRAEGPLAPGARLAFTYALGADPRVVCEVRS